jgi:hypothetical protein
MFLPVIIINQIYFLCPKFPFWVMYVPIMTSDGCGCHNNNNAQGSNYNAFPFTRFDTTYGAGGVIKSIMRRVDYGAIIARVDTLRQWASGTIGHREAEWLILPPSTGDHFAMDSARAAL